MKRLCGTCYRKDCIISPTQYLRVHHKHNVWPKQRSENIYDSFVEERNQRHMLSLALGFGAMSMIMYTKHQKWPRSIRYNVQKAKLADIELNKTNTIDLVYTYKQYKLQFIETTSYYLWLCHTVCQRRSTNIYIPLTLLAATIKLLLNLKKSLVHRILIVHAKIM